jgi:hypothetical protein
MTRHRVRVRRTLALFLFAASVLSGCGAGDRRVATTPGHDTVTRATDAGTLRADSARNARNATLEPGELGTVPTELVTGFSGPGGQPFSVTVRTATPKTALFRRFGSITLRTSARERTPDLGQYPCSSCHLDRGTVLHDQRKPDAHENLKVGHPVQLGSACSTCHATANVEQLTLKTGEHASLDHAYQLCAQCHFQQVERWAGGAHGKRLDGWQGRRVVMGCSDCHNPHNPAIDPRTPFRAPRIERTRGTTK